MRIIDADKLIAELRARAARHAGDMRTYNRLASGMLSELAGAIEAVAEESAPVPSDVAERCGCEESVRLRAALERAALAFNDARCVVGMPASMYAHLQAAHEACRAALGGRQ